MAARIAGDLTAGGAPAAVEAEADPAVEEAGVDGVADAVDVAAVVTAATVVVAADVTKPRLEIFTKAVGPTHSLFC